MQKKIILVAGGTGLIGESLVSYLREKGHEVRVLSRQETNVSEKIYNWSPVDKVIDQNALTNVQVIFNLVGAGIADKRWTSERKKELIDSRVIPALFLSSVAEKSTTLEHYVSSSGINCYGYNNYSRKHQESDPYGEDFLSQVVKLWEEAADTFRNFTKVAKIRTAVVLTDQGGALPKIASPIQNYIGAPLGSGKQWMPWITLIDLIRVFEHIMENKYEGAFNVVAGNKTNKDFTKTLAKVLNKPLWLPPVPAFVLKIALGEMSSVVLKGIQADNKKLKDTGFNFENKSLEESLAAIYDKKN